VNNVGGVLAPTRGDTKKRLRGKKWGAHVKGSSVRKKTGPENRDAKIMDILTATGLPRLTHAFGGDEKKRANGLAKGMA